MSKRGRDTMDTSAADVGNLGVALGLKEPAPPTCSFCGGPSARVSDQACTACVPDLSKQTTAELSRLAALYATAAKRGAPLAQQLYEYVLALCGLIEARAEAGATVAVKGKEEKHAGYRASAEKRAEALFVQCAALREQLPTWAQGSEVPQ